MALNDLLFDRAYQWVGLNGSASLQSSFPTGLSDEGDEVIMQYTSGACSGSEVRGKLNPAGLQGWSWQLPAGCGSGGGGFGQLPSGTVRFLRVPVVPDPDPVDTGDDDPPVGGLGKSAVDPLNTQFRFETGKAMASENGKCSCQEKSWLWLVLLAAGAWWLLKGRK